MLRFGIAIRSWDDCNYELAEGVGQAQGRYKLPPVTPSWPAFLNWEMKWEMRWSMKYCHFGIDMRSWYIWNYKSAEGVGLESKVEAPSCQMKTMPPSRAPQTSRCQASASQQGPPICPSSDGVHRAENGIDLLFEWIIYALKMILKGNVIESWTRNWKIQSQAEPSQAGQTWNEVRFEILIVSRAQDPEAWGRVCWTGTVFLWTFPIPTDDSCLLSTRDKEARARQIFWRMKSKKKFWMN